jgi:hypothetical protein
MHDFPIQPEKSFVCKASSIRRLSQRNLIDSYHITIACKVAELSRPFDSAITLCSPQNLASA